MRTETNYDEASRYLSKEAGARFQFWLLGATQERFAFGGFLDPVLKVPDAPQRICDVLARLDDRARGGYTCAVLTEFELSPDPDMFGRLLVAGGLVFVHMKPTPHPGDRYDLIAVVVNLTGRGNAARDMAFPMARWTLAPREVNMCDLDAAKILDDIAAGRAPMVLLAFVPLMKNGCEDDTMKRWIQVVSDEPDSKRRGDFSLAVVFAQAVGQREKWRRRVEGITMADTPLVAEWKAASKVLGKIETLQLFLARYGEIPADLLEKIQASKDPAQIDGWILTAARAKTLNSFRKQAKL